MKKLLASAVAALALTVTANVASAEEQDVAKIKCSEFLQSGSTMPLLIMWIDGYLSAASDNKITVYYIIKGIHQHGQDHGHSHSEEKRKDRLLLHESFIHDSNLPYNF